MILSVQETSGVISFSCAVSGKGSLGNGLSNIEWNPIKVVAWIKIFNRTDQSVRAGYSGVEYKSIPANPAVGVVIPSKLSATDVWRVISICVPDVGEIRILHAGDENPTSCVNCFKICTGNRSTYWGFNVESETTMELTLTKSEFGDDPYKFSIAAGAQELPVLSCSPNDIYPIPCAMGDVSVQSVNLFTGDLMHPCGLLEVGDGRISYSLAALYNSAGTFFQSHVNHPVIKSNPSNDNDSPENTLGGIPFMCLTTMSSYYS
jgi:hypothetical protein